MTEEEWLRNHIDQILRKARAEMQPFVDRLVEIECAKPPKPIFVLMSEINDPTTWSIK